MNHLKIIKKLQGDKEKILQQLIQLPIEKLYELHKLYYDWYKGS